MLQLLALVIFWATIVALFVYLYATFSLIIYRFVSDQVKRYQQKRNPEDK